LQNHKDPHKTRIALSNQPDQEWMDSFFRHWKETMKNVFPKPEIQIDGKQMLVITKSDFAIRYIISALNCIEKVNSDHPLQIKVDPEWAKRIVGE
jgi:hypothetical protein